jgi:hypothetical protein
LKKFTFTFTRLDSDSTRGHTHGAPPLPPCLFVCTIVHCAVSFLFSFLLTLLACHSSVTCYNLQLLSHDIRKAFCRFLFFSFLMFRCVDLTFHVPSSMYVTLGFFFVYLFLPPYFFFVVVILIFFFSLMSVLPLSLSLPLLLSTSSISDSVYIYIFFLYGIESPTLYYICMPSHL